MSDVTPTPNGSFWTFMAGYWCGLAIGVVVGAFCTWLVMR